MFECENNRIAVVGSRTFNNYQFLKYILDKHILNKKRIVPVVIISGGARGADSLAKRYALENQIELIEYLPEWGKYGKSAGYKRNQLIIDSCDICIAFWDYKSKGTRHSINICKNQNKPCYIYKVSI